MLGGPEATPLQPQQHFLKGRSKMHTPDVRAVRPKEKARRTRHPTALLQGAVKERSRSGQVPHFDDLVPRDDNQEGLRNNSRYHGTRDHDRI